MVQRLHQHSIGYMGDCFYRSKDPTNSINVLKEKATKENPEKKQQNTLYIHNSTIKMYTYKTQHWIGLSSALHSCQHSIGYMGDGFYRSKDPTNSIKVLKVQIVHRQIKHTIIRHEHAT